MQALLLQVMFEHVGKLHHEHCLSVQIYSWPVLLTVSLPPAHLIMVIILWNDHMASIFEF